MGSPGMLSNMPTQVKNACRPDLLTGKIENLANCIIHESLSRNIIKKGRIFLSPPHMGGEEFEFIKKAFDSNYIAPLGPMVNTFEREFAVYIGIRHCAAVSSGTAAMHLGLRHLFQKSGGSVQCAGGR